jgi:ribosomal protein RSM22 (predicted rRNA methylase)
MLNQLANENILLQKLSNLVVKNLLPTEAFRQYELGKIGNQYLLPYCNIIKNISEQYTTLNYSKRLEIDDAIAYALYYMPINFVKVLRAINLCELDNSKVINILDFGAGTGTATLAVSALFDKFNAVAVEKSFAMQEVLKKLITSNIVIKEKITDLNCKFELIVCANSINELSDELAYKTFSELNNYLADDGYFIIIEPALKSVTQRIMSFRDWLLENTDLNIYYPCTHANNCPMLVNDKDGWCHTELSWQKPSLVAQIDQLTGFNKHRLKTSVLIFSKRKIDYSGFRVVNFPKKQKKGIELTLCSDKRYKNTTVSSKLGKKIQNYSWLGALVDD